MQRETITRFGMAHYIGSAGIVNDTNRFFYCPPARRYRSETEKTAIMSYRTLTPYTQAESPRLPVYHAFSSMDRIPLPFYGKKSPDRLSEIRVTE